MAKFFTKILCAIDFDDNSMAALDYACRLAKENDATLYVMHVVFVPVTSRGFPMVPYQVVSEAPSKLQLEQIARERLNGKVRYEVLARTGRPDEAVNKAAEDLDVDLIVMATHGRTGVARFFLGSVVEHVVRGSKRPVLTIRPSGGEDTSE